MPDRLSALDASFLYMEQPTIPMHIGGVAVFRPPRSGFDHGRLTDLIKRRLTLVRRYRQKVRNVPGHLARPMWVDDPDFDISYHVRHSTLPPPGTEEQLHDLVARVMSRPLDRKRPLWEIHLVEGLHRGRIAIITKTHHAMIDGVSAMDVGQVILDVTPTPQDTPGGLHPVMTATGEVVHRSADMVNNVRRMGTTIGELFDAVRTAVRAAPISPLNVPTSGHRRYAVARTALEDYKLIRMAHGGTVHDVVLAVISGALRTWLLSRGQVVRPSTIIRAIAPVLVRDAETPESFGTTLSAYLVDLPVGEPNAVVRLHHISQAMRAHTDSDQSVRADVLVRLGGLAPPTMHALGARVVNGFSQRIYNLVITNVPGPQFPLYAAGAKMLEMFPVVPLSKNQGLAIGVTSYDGGVYFGLTADRDAMTDVEGVAAMIEESLDELVGTAPR
jgi:diacylglycerol O-acyltransferase / wax synthase